MTDKTVPPIVDANLAMDEEAARRLMIFLCEGEVEAEAAAELLLRDSTPEEIAELTRMYALGDEMARQKARELGFEQHPRLANQQALRSAPAPLSEAEIVEFDLYMRGVYARLDASASGDRVLSERIEQQSLTASTDIANKQSVPTAAQVSGVATYFAAFWQGLLESFQPLPMTADGMLADNGLAATTYEGVEAFLTALVPAEALQSELKWAAGKLRLICARSSDGQIRTIRASIGRSSTAPPEGANIRLILSDQKGESVELMLRPRSAASVASDLRLSGELKLISLTVALDSAT